MEGSDSGLNCGICNSKESWGNCGFHNWSSDGMSNWIMRLISRICYLSRLGVSDRLMSIGDWSCDLGDGLGVGNWLMSVGNWGSDGMSRIMRLILRKSRICYLSHSGLGVNGWLSISDWSCDLGDGLGVGNWLMSIGRLSIGYWCSDGMSSWIMRLVLRIS